MGEVKSVRLNKEAENMLNSIKKYYSITKNSKNDTEIILTGIETLFENISEKVNQEYRDSMKKILDDKLILLFDKTCDLLEILATSCGNFLEDELKFFIVYTQRLEQVQNTIKLTHEEALRMNVFKYDKVESVLARSGYTEKDFTRIALILKDYYEK